MNAQSRCVDHDEDVVVRGSGLDRSTDDHLDDNNEQRLVWAYRNTNIDSHIGTRDA